MVVRLFVLLVCCCWYSVEGTVGGAGGHGCSVSHYRDGKDCSLCEVGKVNALVDQKNETACTLCELPLTSSLDRSKCVRAIVCCMSEKL